MSSLLFKSFYLYFDKRIACILLVILFKYESWASNPNIIFILADDMGYGDVQSINTRSKLPTPNLNILASQGMTFIDAHSPSAVCTPTRYATLTGRYCWRSKLKRGVLNGYGAPLLEPERETVASMLRSKGYNTSIVGKWHLGLDFNRNADGKINYNKSINDGPNQHGFDYSYIIPASLDFPPYIYIKNGKIIELPNVNQQSVGFPGFLRSGPRQPGLIINDCLDDLTSEANRVIREGAKISQPFFLYFPLTAPHKPVKPHSRFIGKSKLGLYGDFIMQVDWTVGQVMRTIQTAGIEKNTLLIFTSDNGSFMYREEGNEQGDHVSNPKVQSYSQKNHTSNGVLRGTKADIWEAGHRVPFFARWPGVIKSGSICKKTTAHVDFFATCSQIVGGTLMDNMAEDSFSWLPLFKGGDWDRPRAPVINHSASGMFALRSGKWKLIAGNGSGGRQPPRGKPFEMPYMLFDLQADLEEKNNLASAKPSLVRQLAAKLEAIRSNGRSR
ncbi:MAG: Cerebroside-sulfatase [Verrucomicrobiales bacterium]|nr:Cerebroside-sulfatase [Verrucomicrobiales bacterium]